MLSLIRTTKKRRPMMAFLLACTFFHTTYCPPKHHAPECIIPETRQYFLVERSQLIARPNTQTHIFGVFQPRKKPLPSSPCHRPRGRAHTTAGSEAHFPEPLTPGRARPRCSSHPVYTSTQSAVCHSDGTSSSSPFPARPPRLSPLISHPASPSSRGGRVSRRAGRSAWSPAGSRSVCHCRPG